MQPLIFTGVSLCGSNRWRKSEQAMAANEKFRNNTVGETASVNIAEMVLKCSHELAADPSISYKH